MQLLAENAVWNRNIPFLVHYFIALSRVTRPLARISHPQRSMSASCRRGGIPSNWAAHSPAPFRTQHSAEERGFCQNAATGATHSSTPCWIWPWAGDEGMCWNVFQHLPLSSSQSWISYFSFRNRAVVEYAVSPPPPFPKLKWEEAEGADPLLLKEQLPIWWEWHQHLPPMVTAQWIPLLRFALSVKRRQKYHKIQGYVANAKHSSTLSCSLMFLFSSYVDCLCLDNKSLSQ